MRSSTPSNGLKPMTMVLLLGLALVVVAGNVGCDETGYMPWGGSIDPYYSGNTGSGDLYYSNALGTYVADNSYWSDWGFGIQNVPSWGGWVDPWYTSSLGLPRF